ncbi:putative glucose receptor git3 [Diplodia seriata]|uniref:Putative glucose receptor git3 n=1 Tax=Diplodia seriata TaxID=420778 RepID=A0A0G2GYD6_9PEZI|nr:putative glucose receptor git3 [Diplodia seriata]
MHLERVDRTAVCADFSILAIALVTVLTITRKTYMPDASLGRKVMICTSVWIVPLITSHGNWCWITSQRTDLRYALGHGWRFAIMFITIGVYIYVWWYMRQHFQKMAGTHEAKGSIDLNATYRTNRPRAASFATFRSSNDLAKEMSMERKDSASTYDEELQLEYARMPKKNHLVAVVVDSARNNFPASGRPRATQFPGSGGAINAKFTFNRMLLLNAYPTAWVLLWLPGIANRLLEATGHTSIKALAVLQSSSHV